MPRRYRKKKGGAFMRGLRKRGRIYGRAGYQLYKDVMWLKSVVNVEKKYIDTAASTTSSSTAAFVLLNGLTTGDTGQTRDGQSIKCSSLLLRYVASINALATTSIHRVIIFLDNQPNGTAPTAAELLDVTSSSLSPLNIDYGTRFKVIRDVITNLSQNGQQIRTVKKFVKLRFHTKFNTGTAGTIADITRNSLYMLHQSDQGTNVVTFAYQARVRFIDN